MCNCNQKRETYKSANSSRTAARGLIKVKLVGETPMALNGQVTGRNYLFRNQYDEHWVDKRDAMYMKEISGLQLFF